MPPSFYDHAAKEKDKNIRTLLENYKAQKEFFTKEEVYILNYKNKSYLAGQDILRFYNAKDTVNAIFDSFTPVDIKKLSLDTRARFVNYNLKDPENVYSTEGISINLEIDSKPLTVSFLDFERIFVYPRSGHFFDEWGSLKLDYSQICHEEKLYRFSDIDYLVTKKARIVNYVKAHSEILNRVIGDYFLDVKDEKMHLCYQVKVETEEEKLTLKANLNNVLRGFDGKI